MSARLPAFGGNFILARSGLFEILLIKFILFDSIKLQSNIQKLMKIESDAVNKPSVQIIAKIAKALGVSIEELIKQGN